VRLNGLVHLENVKAMVTVMLAKVTKDQTRICTGKHRYRYCLFSVNLDGDCNIDIAHHKRRYMKEYLPHWTL